MTIARFAATAQVTNGPGYEELELYDPKAEAREINLLLSNIKNAEQIVFQNPCFVTPKPLKELSSVHFRLNLSHLIGIGSSIIPCYYVFGGPSSSKIGNHQSQSLYNLCVLVVWVVANFVFFKMLHKQFESAKEKLLSFEGEIATIRSLWEKNIGEWGPDELQSNASNAEKINDLKTRFSSLEMGVSRQLTVYRLNLREELDRLESVQTQINQALGLRDRCAKRMEEFFKKHSGKCKVIHLEDASQSADGTFFKLSVKERVDKQMQKIIKNVQEETPDSLKGKKKVENTFGIDDNYVGPPTPILPDDYQAPALADLFKRPVYWEETLQFKKQGSGLLPDSIEVESTTDRNLKLLSDNKISGEWLGVFDSISRVVDTLPKKVDSAQIFTHPTRYTTRHVLLLIAQIAFGYPKGAPSPDLPLTDNRFVEHVSYKDAGNQQIQAVICTWRSNRMKEVIKNPQSDRVGKFTPVYLGPKEVRAHFIENKNLCLMSKIKAE